MRDNHFVETYKVQPYAQSLAYDVFIDETIDAPEYYRNVINALNKAAEGDVINMYINTGGGMVHTASAITSAMEQCKAHIIAHLPAEVCSAGTKIALKAHDWVVGEDVVFMCHNTSFGVFGSSEKIRDQHDFIQDWSSKMIKRDYEGFLTDEEIDLLVKGKEYWFGQEEVLRRLENFVEHKKHKHMSAIEEHFNKQIEEEDALSEKAISLLVEKGKITKKEAERFKEIVAEADKLFENGEIDLGCDCGDPTCGLPDDKPQDALQGKPLSSFTMPESELILETGVHPYHRMELEGYVTEEDYVFFYKLKEDDLGDTTVEDMELEYPNGDLINISTNGLEELSIAEMKDILVDVFDITMPSKTNKERVIKRLIKEFEDLTLE